jgi:hypothetical protein
MKKIFKQIAKFFAPVVSLLAPLAALAQSRGSGIEGGLGRVGGSFPDGGGIAGSRTVTELIISIINIMLFFAGMVAVVFIIIGGYWYITSAGNEEQAEKGKGTMVNAIIGIVVIILSWTLISVVTRLVGNNLV